MDVAVSPNGKRLLRALFVLVVVFLYAPIAILVLFSFNNSVLPTFPLSGFTLGFPDGWSTIRTGSTTILVNVPAGQAATRGRTEKGSAR